MPTRSTEPRNKTGAAEALFARPEGATMDEVLKATGGFRYNVLRRLEAKGWLVRRKREGRVTRYWAAAPQVRAFELSVAPNGQVTLPKAVREELGVPRGGRLTLRLESGQRAEIAPVSVSLRELHGMLRKPGKAATLAEIEDGIARGATGL
jgi:bifunctional DNA-binding transcriptional regulator/antitoxin component of YhaV-PrlF toxin-antitoxin module